MVQYLLKQTHECENCQAMFLYEMDWARHVFLDACLPELRKENSMEEQMEQVWRSKDGKVTGSKKEVEAYLKSKNPLSGMRFPYYTDEDGRILDHNRVNFGRWHAKERNAFVAFANLAPLIQEVLKEWEHEWRGDDWRGSIFTERWHNELANLLLAYEEALKQVPQ